MTYAVGSISGRDEDKFNAYGIPVVQGPELGLPPIEEKCLAWMECRLLPATAAQEQYDTLFGEWFPPPPMSARSSADAGSSTTIRSIPLHHLGTGNFVASGRHVRANTPGRIAPLASGAILHHPARLSGAAHSALPGWTADR